MIWIGVYVLADIHSRREENNRTCSTDLYWKYFTAPDWLDHRDMAFYFGSVSPSDLTLNLKLLCPFPSHHVIILPIKIKTYPSASYLNLTLQNSARRSSLSDTNPICEPNIGKPIRTWVWAVELVREVATCATKQDNIRTLRVQVSPSTQVSDSSSTDLVVSSTMSR